jgi:hypothetical protein
MDADCVFYHLDNPSETSKLTCTGLPSNTSLSIILEEFDKRLCGVESTFGIIGEDTDSVNITVTSAGNIYTIKNDVKIADSNSIDFSISPSGVTGSVKIDPSSTAPVSITASGLKVDCCTTNCGSVTKTINSLLTSIDKETNFFATLDPSYFTKSDFIDTLNFTDSSTLVGDTLSFLKYTITKPIGISTFTTVGGTKSIDVNTCATSFLGQTGTLLIEMLSTAGCYESKSCSITTQRVDYTERYAQTYRQNFQINKTPIVRDLSSPVLTDKGILYFSDTVPYGPSTSNGGVIRKINLNTKEVTTISGDLTSGINPTTVNNVLGDVARYDYPSSVCIDENEINNGEPTLYFAVFKNNGLGGKIIRLVKEQDGNCDQRKNWRTYVIAGTGANGFNPSTFLSTVNGSSAIFGSLYGLKQWLPINGAPSFYIADAQNATLQFLYYTGTGNINDGNTWRVTPVSLDGTNVIGLTGIALNINVDYINGVYRLIILEDAKIRFFDWSGSVTPSVGQCRNLSSVGWTPLTVVNNPAGTVDGVTSVARVNQPAHIYRYTDFSTSDNYYIFGQEVPSGLQTQPNQSEYTVVRKIATISSSNYNFSTICQMTSYSFATIGNTGLFGTGVVNGLSTGFFNDLRGNLYDFTLGGIRSWDMDAGTCSLYTGGSSALDTQTEYANLALGLRMDTQYEFEINC